MLRTIGRPVIAVSAFCGIIFASHNRSPDDRLMVPVLWVQTEV
jgi:hypothetical protein